MVTEKKAKDVFIEAEYWRGRAVTVENEVSLEKEKTFHLIDKIN